MKLSFVLNEAGYNPVDLNTDAVLTFVDGKIISIELNLSANVPGVSKEEFKELTEDAKKNSPISRLLIVIYIKPIINLNIIKQILL